ncbi:MAG: diadenylate cyclase CdaA [Clostridia bacterium]|nr:diadenylate cyclase CdaA [Clostridia bacterium]
MEFLYTLRNALVTFRVQDVVDILIVAFIFYKLLSVFKNTSGIKILWGIILIMVVSQVSGWLKLYLLNSIFSGALQIGIIAVVIVFQPELRSMLERLGRRGFNIRHYISRPDRDGTADLLNTAVRISEACAKMSREKTGALIVIQMRTHLAEIANTGTAINADISAALLENIFFHNSPLHDGAVLIEGNKILAAGCVLPLSKNDMLSKELGTRHRAGIGITEQSDAVTVIVSEETGTISVAEGGMLKRHLNAETLTRIIEKALTHDIPEENKKGFSFRIFRKGE